MTYSSRVLQAAAVVAIGFLLWTTREVLLLVFGGVLFSVVLWSFADLIRKWLGLNLRAAVTVGVLLIAALAAGFTYWLGNELSAQLADLSDRLPRAVSALRDWVSGTPIGPGVMQHWDALQESGLPWKRVVDWTTFGLGALAKSVLILMLAIFIAAEPKTYRSGALRLLAPRHRGAAGEALDACAKALRGWLKGQGISMVFVGAATAIGLALLDVPLALILGLLAGLLDFVPFFGPIVSGALAVLVAITVGPQTAFYVALLGLAIQQVEGNLVIPLVQRWAVALPPALGVVAVVLVASLFGVAGILFATPMMVVAMVLIKKLYVERVLENGNACRRSPGETR